MILFADDTSLFHAHTHFHTLIEEVNIELQKIAIWFNTNKLTLNVKKSNNYFIIFTPKGNIYNTDNADIIINGNKIKQIKLKKIIGIHIDEHLSWAIHINNLSNKLHEM